MNLYAEPRTVTDPTACLWYHTMDLPEIGTVKGQWDLRETADEYLGRFDFAGLRCLDVGTAGGFLTFEMERRGASSVVSFDIDAERHNWDVVPFSDAPWTVEAFLTSRRERLHRFQDGYWLAHRLMGSRARVCYGTAHAIPAALGAFDVAIIGQMLPHVRDPFAVLAQVARLCETIIVTQQMLQHEGAFAYLMPDPATLAPYDAWWSLSDGCLERMLAILGYEVVDRVTARHRSAFRDEPEACTATVARRRRG